MIKKKNEFRSECPISTALDIFGDKWSLLIIRDMMFKEKNTYGELILSEEKIATNILANRLGQLEDGGIISRLDHPQSKAKVLYRLTQKGIDLVPVLIELIAWSEKYHIVHPHAKAFAKEIRKDKESLIQGIKAQLRKGVLKG